jgi:benzoylformate decarboxylase
MATHARPAGRPGLVQVHSSPGVSNAIGNLHQARRGGSPLVVFAGEAGIRYDAMDAQMAADLVAMARPVTKRATRVVDPSSVLQVIRRTTKIWSSTAQYQTLRVSPMRPVTARARQRRKPP